MTVSARPHRSRPRVRLTGTWYKPSGRGLLGLERSRTVGLPAETIQAAAATSRCCGIDGSDDSAPERPRFEGERGLFDEKPRQRRHPERHEEGRTEKEGCSSGREQGVKGLLDGPAIEIGPVGQIGRG